MHSLPEPVGYMASGMALLESAVHQPRMTFDQRELYLDLAGKGAALCFSIIQNHPFFDGNKRTGHAAMEVLLILNGHEIHADMQEQEKFILDTASGKIKQDDFTKWLRSHLKPYPS